MANQKVKKVKSKKKKSNIIDFRKEKSAKDFIKSIETGELYEELKPETKEATTTYDRLIKNPSFKKQLEEEYGKLLFSEMLINIMEGEKMSVRKLAVKSGVSSSFIQDLRSGKQVNPSINAISKLFFAMNAELVVKRPGKKPLKLNIAIK